MKGDGQTTGTKSTKSIENDKKIEAGETTGKKGKKSIEVRKKIWKKIWKKIEAGEENTRTDTEEE